MDSAQFAPVIDISAPSAVADLDAACRTAGFFQIVGHGISPAIVDEAMSNVREFFRLPLEEKMKWISTDHSIERGYSARGTEAFAYSMAMETPFDLVEALTVGRNSYPADDPVFTTATHTHFAENIWPNQPARLMESVLTYYDLVEAATHTVTGLMAKALGLPDDFFEERTSHPMDSLRFNYYSATPEDSEPLPGQFGVGPHTDYGLITVMYADPDAVGLQVADTDGVWHDIVPIPGALVVNLGDLIAQWTNDRWRSSLHRVLPMRSAAGRTIERLSAPYFHATNYETVVECLPSCVSDAEPARYPSVIAGEQFDSKFLGGRILEEPDVLSTVGDRGAALKV
ncbi:MAG: putative Oxidoreductase, 2OG-Fe(II) oxygenase family [Pseudonocardiales bacterium]|nr:putative Oxidoreductase, 2OG-Fe(II) oxygenase family [Pseudonocardiales bacterium]